jgi:Rrf2 family transcriptional regulator, nitric oxide-sensitive transcriptional repressor
MCIASACYRADFDLQSTAARIMKLTDYTDYSLRVMLYLALRREGLSTIQEISDAYGISKNHLMKVVQRLGELGWVETIRGRNGGLRLAADSLALPVGDVVRQTESDFALVGCFPDEHGERRPCTIEPHCRLKHALAAARDAFLAELDRYTIGELASPKAELAGLLGLAPIVLVPPEQRVATRSPSRGH